MVNFTFFDRHAALTEQHIYEAMQPKRIDSTADSIRGTALITRCCKTFRHSARPVRGNPTHIQVKQLGSDAADRQTEACAPIKRAGDTQEAAGEGGGRYPHLEPSSLPFLSNSDETLRRHEKIGQEGMAESVDRGTKD